jgi:iron complex transport system substrate-binding protein
LVTRCVSLFSLCYTLAISAAAAFAAEVVDDLGMAVDLERSPQRLVSLAPSNTELLFALGLGERLVGVTEYCNHPEAAKNIPQVAGYSTVNLESIVATRPDLVIAARGNDLQSLASLRALGISVFALDVQSVEQLITAAGRLGSLLEAEARGDSLMASWRRRIAQITARVDTTYRPRVMWGYWGETVYTAGHGNAIDDLINLAGGINPGRAAPGIWPQIGLETVVSWAPDVIVTTYLPGAADAEVLGAELQRLRNTDGWKTLPAVRNGRVHYVPSDWMMRPGPRMLEALELLVDQIHAKHPQ